MSIQWMLSIYLYEEEIDGADNFCRDLADVRPLKKHSRQTWWFAEYIERTLTNFYRDSPLCRAAPQSWWAILRLSCLMRTGLKSSDSYQTEDTSVDVFSELSPPELFFWWVFRFPEERNFERLLLDGEPLLKVKRYGASLCDVSLCFISMKAQI